MRERPLRYLKNVSCSSTGLLEPDRVNHSTESDPKKEIQSLRLGVIFL